MTCAATSARFTARPRAGTTSGSARASVRSCCTRWVCARGPPGVRRTHRRATPHPAPLRQLHLQVSAARGVRNSCAASATKSRCASRDAPRRPRRSLSECTSGSTSSGTGLQGIGSSALGCGPHLLRHRVERPQAATDDVPDQQPEQRQDEEDRGERPQGRGDRELLPHAQRLGDLDHQPRQMAKRLASPRSGCAPSRNPALRSRASHCRAWTDTASCRRGPRSGRRNRTRHASPAGHPTDRARRRAE